MIEGAKIIVLQYCDSLELQAYSATGEKLARVSVDHGESYEPLVEFFKSLGIKAEFEEVY